MEKFIPEAEVLDNIKRYRESLSYDELFDIEMETKRLYLSDKGREKLDKQRTYVQYLGDRYGRHKKK